MFCSCHTHYVPAVHLRGRGPPPECRCHRGGGELCNTEAQPQGGRRAERWEDRRPPAPAVSRSDSDPGAGARQPPLSMGFFRPNTGAGCHSLLQGIFPAQGSNPCLLRRQVDSSPLHHQGNRPQTYKGDRAQRQAGVAEGF